MKAFRTRITALLFASTLATSVLPAHAESDAKKARGDAPCLCWVKPLAPPRAVILCVHGLGLHSGSYEQFGKAMSQRGYAVYAIDVRGFGSWMEAKGHQTVNFTACMEDVKSTVEVIKRANQGLPVILLGESMGGAIALQTVAQYPDLVDGLISAVPAAERFEQKKTDLKVFLHMLTRRKVSVEKDVVDKATQKESLREEWKDDPLGKMKLSPKELIQFQVFMNKNHERAKDITKTPVLIVQGGKDKLVKAEGTKELFEELATKDKNLAVVNGAEHLIYEEGQFTNDVIRLTDQWITQRIPQGQLTADADLIRKAKLAVQQRDVPGAISLLEQSVQINPANPEAHFLLGIGYQQTQKPDLAKDHFRKAMRLSQLAANPELARKANDSLLAMPANMVAPWRRNTLALQGNANGPRRFGPRARMQRMRMAQMQAQSQSNLSAGSDSNLAGGSPYPKPPLSRNLALAGDGNGDAIGKVYIFSAKWCEPCKDLDPIISEAKTRFGNRVEFVMVDVDDPKNESLVEQYNVSPIPTVVFVKANGDVADYSVGYSGVAGMIKGMAKLLSSK